MFRLCSQADAEDLPRMYDPIDTLTTDTLYRLGKELSHAVSTTSTSAVAVVHVASLAMSTHRRRLTIF